MFKNFAAHYRPQLNMDEIRHRQVWLVEAALGKLLVDELKTSDSTCRLSQERDVYGAIRQAHSACGTRRPGRSVVYHDRVLVTERLLASRMQ